MATNVAVADNPARADFCDLYATQVAQNVVRSRPPFPGGPPIDDVAGQLAQRSPVTDAELEAAAPPEALSWLGSVDGGSSLVAASPFGAATSFAVDDPIFQNLVSLNDWSVAHCDAKYRPVFTEYRGIMH